MMTPKLPRGFVYLQDIDPSIEQDLRYATTHNFTGRIVPGYLANECILRIQAARALAKVQDYLRPHGLGLRIYDAYRPAVAVKAFASWSRLPARPWEKERYYPRLHKRELIRDGYIATRSQHSRGNTVDLTLVYLDKQQRTSAIVDRDADTKGCLDDESWLVALDEMDSGAGFQGSVGDQMNILPAMACRDDDSLVMGTAFDCFDPLAHTRNRCVRGEARRNRRLLQQVMRLAGFSNFPTEWWHFTYHERATPCKYYNFPVHAKPGS